MTALDYFDVPEHGGEAHVHGYAQSDNPYGFSTPAGIAWARQWGEAEAANRVRNRTYGATDEQYLAGGLSAPEELVKPVLEPVHPEPTLDRYLSDRSSRPRARPVPGRARRDRLDRSPAARATPRDDGRAAAGASSSEAPRLRSDDQHLDRPLEEEAAVTLALASSTETGIVVLVLVAAALFALIGFLSTHDDRHLDHLEDELRRRPPARPTLRTYSVFDWRVRGDEELRNDDGPGRSRTLRRVDQQPTAR